MAFQASLVSVVSQQLTQLLHRVCEDYNLPAEEVLPRYLEAQELPPVAAPKKAPRQPKKAPAPERPMCSGQVKGQPCKHKAQVGDDLCHIHKKQRDNPKAPPAPKRVCTGTTSKGAPCTVKAQEGHDLCHLHLAKANLPPKAPRVVKKPAKKAVAPQVEGRGESPPPVFCQPCPPEPQEEVEIPAEEAEDEMEAMRLRLQAIMVGSPAEDEEKYTPTREALESQGFSDDPEDFDEEQMESPHSQRALEAMKEFDGFMEE
jgi:hypothetical protein